MDSDDELQTIVMEQSREFATAKAVEFDLDLAFQLQMQEVMSTSIALYQSQPSSSSTPPQFQFPDDDASDVSYATSLVAEEIARYERERSDRKQAEAEMRLMHDHLGRRIHDQASARELSRIADDEWVKIDDHVVRPYDNGYSSFAILVPNAEPLRLYFKGLVREERVRGTRKMSAVVGIALCDMRDDHVFEMRKPLVGGGDMIPELAEVKALILGLDAAITLGIKQLTICCGDNLLHQYVSHFVCDSSNFSACVSEYV